MQALYFAEPQKIIIIMIGLPARGKSYIAKKIVRFLKWLGYNSEVFNIGNYRRQYMKSNNSEMNVSYFDNQNEFYSTQRQQIAQLALNNLVKFLNNGGHIGVLDGTNSTVQRRNKIKQYVKKHMNEKYFLFCIESICQKQDIIQKNVTKVKIYNPDYFGKSPQFSANDFYKRIQLYKKYYKQIDKSEEIPFLKTINLGEDFLIHAIYGYLPEKIVTFVMNITISSERIIYVLRHGQTNYNLQDRIGGNPHLNQNGVKFSECLRIFFNQQQMPNKQNVRILTSTLNRTIQTAKKIKISNYDPIQLKVLDQINAGICETMKYQEVLQKYPEIYLARQQDKLAYRYPSGESYLDLISRLQPVIQWIERQKFPIIVVAHQAVLRCFYAYFFGTQKSQIPYIPIELNSVIKLTPETYFFSEKKYLIDLNEKKICKVIQKQKRKSLDIVFLKLENK